VTPIIVVFIIGASLSSSNSPSNTQINTPIFTSYNITKSSDFTLEELFYYFSVTCIIEEENSKKLEYSLQKSKNFLILKFIVQKLKVFLSIEMINVILDLNQMPL